MMLSHIRNVYFPKHVGQDGRDIYTRLDDMTTRLLARVFSYKYILGFDYDFTYLYTFYKRVEEAPLTVLDEYTTLSLTSASCVTRVSVLRNCTHVLL